MERDPLVRGLLLMLAAIGAVWLAGWIWQVVSRFADILLLFFLAWLLAFVLNPLARRLETLGVPRLGGVILVYLGLAIGLVTIALLVVPAAVNQMVQLGASLPLLADDLQQRADELHASLIARGLPEAQLSEVYRNAIARAEAIGTTALSNSLAIATAIAGGLLRASLVLILSFYIMLDGEKIGRLFVGLMPRHYRERVDSALSQIDRTFGGFVRGQLLQAAVYSLGTWAVMHLASLPFALVLSIFAGLAMIIPVIGPYLAMGPPLVLALTLNPAVIWWVFALLFLLQFVVVNVLAPRIMSYSVGIHPLLVFAAVLIGARIADGWGAIFGVPVAAVLFILVKVFYQRVVLLTPLYRRGEPLSVDSIAPYHRPVAGEPHTSTETSVPPGTSATGDLTAPPEMAPTVAPPLSALARAGRDAYEAATPHPQAEAGNGRDSAPPETFDATPRVSRPEPTSV